MSTLWHGRFADTPAEALLAYTASIGFDGRLAADDIAGSCAHVQMLAQVGLLTDEESRTILAALAQTEAELLAGDFCFAPNDEDIHSAIERRVTELAGSTGAKLHTARSRNDQVATALRLFTKRELAVIAKQVLTLQEVLLERAIRAAQSYLPGYTHLQRAQPVLLAHHLLAHGWALARDVDRLANALARLDVSPLGAGAIAGSSLPINPEITASILGFSSVFENSMDAVSDRDFVAESLFALSMVGIHLSRLGSEIVFWTSAEAGFACLDDAYATGSSMLPQKKNPDIAELARGKAGRLIGNLAGFLATIQGLPLAYNRDLQEDKEPLFDAVDQVYLGLQAITGLMATISFDTQAMATAADAPTMAATDLAEHLVASGMAFREAHVVVADLVRRSMQGEGSLVDLVRADPRLGEPASALLAPGVAVGRRSTMGGAGPEPVAAQIARFQNQVANDRARFG